MKSGIKFCFAECNYLDAAKCCIRVTLNTQKARSVTVCSFKIFEKTVELIIE